MTQRSRNQLPAPTWAPADLPRVLRSRLETPDWPAAAEMVKQNRKRTVYRLALNLPELSAVYIKHDHPRGWRDRVKGLWRCKAECEFRAGRALEQAGVGCVHLLGWARSGHDSWLVSAEAGGSQPFRDVWQSCLADPARRAAFLEGLVRFQSALLAAGVRHPDLHPGNVLAASHPDRYRFQFVDVYGVAVGRALDQPGRERLFHWLTCVLQELSLVEGRRFLTRCGLVATAAEFRRTWERLWREMGQDTDYRWGSRRQRFCATSSLLIRQRTESGDWRLVRPFGLAAAEAALAAHQRQMRDGKDVVKDDRKRCLTRVTVEQHGLIVKEFRQPGPWGRWAADARCWYNHQHLEFHAVGVPVCHGWLHARDGRGFLIFADAGRVNLYAALRGARSSTARRRLLQAAAILVARLHLRGIVHGDLKIHNFMVLPGAAAPGFRLELVDPDQIRFGQRLAVAQRRQNLAQFLDTLYMDFPRSLAIPFLAAYRRYSLLSRREFRRLALASAAQAERG